MQRSLASPRIHWQCGACRIIYLHHTSVACHLQTILYQVIRILATSIQSIILRLGSISILPVLFEPQGVTIMRSDLIIAATSLLGSASAGVHRMKLQKVPLSQQLVRPRQPIRLVFVLADMRYRKPPTLAIMSKLSATNTAKSSWVPRRTSSVTLPSTKTRRCTQYPSRTS